MCTQRRREREGEENERGRERAGERKEETRGKKILKEDGRSTRVCTSAYVPQAEQIKCQFEVDVCRAFRRRREKKDSGSLPMTTDLTFKSYVQRRSGRNDYVSVFFRWTSWNRRTEPKSSR